MDKKPQPKTPNTTQKNPSQGNRPAQPGQGSKPAAPAQKKPGSSW